MKKLGCLGYIEDYDYDTQLYGDYHKIHKPL